MPASNPHNPYHPTRPASEAIFVGRADQCRRLIRELCEEGRCASIVGGPGIGKTSLLHAIRRALLADTRAGHGPLALVVYIDMRPEYATIETLLVEMVRGLVVALRDQRNLHCAYQTVGRALRLAEQRQQIGEVQAPILRWAFAQEQQRHAPILLLDNIHRVGDIQAFATIASVLQAAVNNHKITCALAGRDELVDGMRNDTSPLRLLVTYQAELGPLTENETCTLVAKAGTYGWEVEEDCAVLAHQLTGGHPYRLHYYLSDVLSSDDRLTCDGMRRRQPVIDPYLNAVLGAQPAASAGSTISDEQFKEEVRQMVREAHLEEALGALLHISRLRLKADLLMFRLRQCSEQERMGLADRNESSAEYMAIAAAVLNLLNV